MLFLVLCWFWFCVLLWGFHGFLFGLGGFDWVFLFFGCFEVALQEITKKTDQSYRKIMLLFEEKTEMLLWYLSQKVYLLWFFFLVKITKHQTNKLKVLLYYVFVLVLC